MIPSAIIANVLIQTGHASKHDAGVAWPVFVGHLPHDPPDALCVYDGVGVVLSRSARSGQYAEKPGVQIRARSVDYLRAYAKLESIRAELDTLSNHQVSTQGTDSIVLAHCSRTSSILSLGLSPQTSRRTFELTINYTLTY